MQENSRQKMFDIILTTKSPLFIGSGKEFNKKEYYHNKKEKVVHIINHDILFEMLISNNLIDEYERFILNRPNEYLDKFLSDCKFKKSHINKITDYQINIGDAIFDGHALSEIMQFMRNSKGQPYVSGSSLKGCLRTAILWQLISENNSVDKNQSIKDIEACYLNTLKINKNNQKDVINSVMRGISISDSLPIDNKDMVLAKKEDLTVEGNINTINLIRESVAPGTKIHFIMTIDESISHPIDANYIINVVNNYSNYYKNTFLKSFKKQSHNLITESFENCIVLGGGSGYFGKNIMYPLHGKNVAVEKVSKIMCKNFGNSKHEKDIQYGISPHMLKLTKYKSNYYQFGICDFKMNEVANIKQT